jgi:hypothetical protein
MTGGLGSRLFTDKEMSQCQRGLYYLDFAERAYNRDTINKREHKRMFDAQFSYDLCFLNYQSRLGCIIRGLPVCSPEYSEPKK